MIIMEEFIVANHKSAKKRARQTLVRNERNTVKRSMTKTAIKKIRVAIKGNDSKMAQSLLPEAQKLLFRLAKNGIIKNNTAARKISRLSKQANKC